MDIDGVKIREETVRGRGRGRRRRDSRGRERGGDGDRQRREEKRRRSRSRSRSPRSRDRDHHGSHRQSGADLGGGLLGLQPPQTILSSPSHVYTRLTIAWHSSCHCMVSSHSHTLGHERVIKSGRGSLKVGVVAIFFARFARNYTCNPTILKILDPPLVVCSCC